MTQRAAGARPGIGAAPASLRRRLMIYLLGVFIVSWLIMVAATYEEARHEIEEVFDAQLAQVAGLLNDVAIENRASLGRSGRVLSQAVFGHKYERVVGFQIWHDGALLFRSQSAPGARFNGSDGYFDDEIDGVRWRVFALNPTSGYRVYAGESYYARDELTHDIALTTLVPLLWAIPVLGILVWIAIGRGLAPLRRVTREVAGRDPRRLEPLPGDGVPPEIRTLVDAINELLARLGAAFDRERQFTADAAHELRTPLAGLKAQAQVALSAPGGAERDTALCGVVEGVDRATRLVAQLLDLARVDARSALLRPQPVDLGEVVEQVLGDLYPAAAAAQVGLAYDDRRAAAGSCRVDGDEAGLHALLRNLVENAIRHAPPGTEVAVALELAGDRLRITVQDSGPGIPAHERARVFQRFYRGAGVSSEPAGAGLGLAIARRLAEVHGGEVVLEDGPGGRGLRAVVLLPIARAFPAL